MKLLSIISMRRERRRPPTMLPRPAPKRQMATQPYVSSRNLYVSELFAAVAGTSVVSVRIWPIEG